VFLGFGGGGSLSGFAAKKKDSSTSLYKISEKGEGSIEVKKEQTTDPEIEKHTWEL